MSGKFDGSGKNGGGGRQQGLFSPAKHVHGSVEWLRGLSLLGALRENARIRRLWFSVWVRYDEEQEQAASEPEPDVKEPSAELVQVE